MAEKKQRKCQDIDLNFLVDRTEKLKSVIENSFGPVGQLCLILQANGHPILTCDGSVILKHVHFADPVAQFLTTCAISFQQQTGDGSKQFILLVSELFNCIKKIVDENNSMLPLQKISRGLIDCEKLVLPTMFERKRHNFTKVDINQIPFIIKGFFNGKFSESLCDILTQLLYAYVQHSINWDCATSSFESLIHYFPVMCILSEGEPTENSYFDSGFVVCKELTVNKNFTESGKFILLKHNLQPVENTRDKIVFDARMHRTVTDILDWIENNSAKLISYYKTQDIKLIISTEKISETVLFFCKKNDILVLNGIEPDEAQYIEEISGIQAVTNPFINLGDENIGEISALNVLVIGNRNYTKIKFTTEYDVVHCNYMVVCGSTRDVIKQYTRTMLNCLKQLKIHSDPSCINLVTEVGGKWEITLSKFLKQQRNFVNTNISIGCDLLSKALLIIPKTLLQNSHSPCKNFIETADQMIPNTDCTLDGVVGKVVTCCDTTMLELIETKIRLINHVTTAVCQLLKLDNVQHVRKLNLQENK